MLSDTICLHRWSVSSEILDTSSGLSTLFCRTTRSVVQTGKWWQEYSSGFSAQQRAAVRTLIEGIRILFWDNIDPAAQQQIVDAEAIWDSSENQRTWAT